ncbi:MAG TPA: hypothetical protein PKM59_08145, partial [Thermodesulfobacteriota bacterium]|nr:hypothetical protein [Thermodesulfobacteriota bacterium]
MIAEEANRIDCKSKLPLTPLLLKRGKLVNTWCGQRYFLPQALRSMLFALPLLLPSFPKRGSGEFTTQERFSRPQGASSP